MFYLQNDGRSLVSVPVTVNAELERQLIAADRQLNQTYQHFLQKLNPVSQQFWREDQRRWIQGRNSVCRFREHTAGPKRTWTSLAASDPAMADCLIGYTRNRISELSRSPSTQASNLNQLPSFEVKAGVGLRSKKSHRSGKYYFELVIDYDRMRGLAATAEASLSVLTDNNDYLIGTSHQIRPFGQIWRLDASGRVVSAGSGGMPPKVVLGVAVDLDEGRFYRHRNGDWMQQQPGVNDGIRIPTDKPVFVQARLSSGMEKLQGEGRVVANFGAQPFAYAPPIGYMGFDADRITVGGHGDNMRFSVENPGDQIAGQPLSTWLERYWHWTRLLPDSPSNDPTGALCTRGQAEEVFFLTGSHSSEPVRRRCQVPRGRYVLLPIINTLAEDHTGRNLSCDELKVPLDLAHRSASDLKLEINGRKLENLKSYEAQTGCFNLYYHKSGMSHQAAGAGYWVVLRFHDAGIYELKFSGKVQSDGFAQDVSYTLDVQ